ncbi:hypothetical protein LACPH_001401 [Lacticaseibacillus parahuelsenbergensis]|uniref:Uncharacterized protein n=1 Tax=Lacticaseibacillus parahuelsenbergensis TaxID=3068305 RepID=A0ABY9L768_9LACO|nr:hypothetical protein [Lacticaseibacillus sp. NCIMB 15471]WLV79350.1 hypothetical protein LACPH_001401 [Lacticaseibacillus sp. NCIMB 15471]
MAKTLPRAVKVWMGANILQIEFDNGQTRFMRTHFIDDYVSAWSPSKGKGKRIKLLIDPTWEWFGSNARIKSDGSIILFEKDTYTPEELWNNSKPSIDHLSGVN